MPRIQSEEVMNVIIFAVRIAAAYENVVLVSVLFLKAEALELIGKWAEALT